MLLRRVTEHVRAQNWTAVALDFVIVVVGVFIGIQVANWNEARQQRATEKVILERLLSDFEAIEQEASSRVESVRGYLAAADRVFDETISDTLLEDDVDLRARVTEIGFLTPVSGSTTFTQLVTSGEMALIRSEPLRRALTEFEGHLLRHRAVNSAFANARVASTTALEAVRVLAPAPGMKLPARYDDYLRRRMASPDFLVSVGKARRLLSVDLMWHERNLANAEIVLAELEK